MTQSISSKKIVEVSYRETDVQNNVLIRCAFVIGIFEKSFSCLPLIASKKITFLPPTKKSYPLRTDVLTLVLKKHRFYIILCKYFR